MVVRNSRCVSYTPRTSAIPKALPSPSSAATAVAPAAAAVDEQPDLLYLSVTAARACLAPYTLSETQSRCQVLSAVAEARGRGDGNRRSL